MRYERKFVLEVVSLPEALAVVRRNPMAFREEFPPRTVNNLYFDTPGFSHYRNHVAGIGERVKVRLRWYGELAPVVRPVLELKRRHGSMGSKQLFPVGGLEGSGGPDPADIGSRLRHQPGLERVRAELDDVVPVLVNRYRRRYFRSADGRLRLTLDTDLEFFACSRAGRAFLTWRTAARATVLELKYPDASVAEAARAVNEFPVRMARMSKYVLGVDLLGV